MYTHTHTHTLQLTPKLAPQASDTVSAKNAFSLTHAHALRSLDIACVSKKVNISRVQRSVVARKRNLQIYTYIDLRADFDPKVITWEVRVHTGATFGYPSC